VEIYRLEGSIDVPEVELNHIEGKIYFSGKSLPEDVKETYNPIIEWISEYIKIPNKQTHAIFKFDYFNTATSKKLLDIFELLKVLKENNNSDLKIDWYYNEGDEDMKEAGQQFSEFIDIDFNLISF
jgi:hypothetical protein